LQALAQLGQASQQNAAAASINPFMHLLAVKNNQHMDTSIGKKRSTGTGFSVENLLIPTKEEDDERDDIQNEGSQASDDEEKCGKRVKVESLNIDHAIKREDGEDGEGWEFLKI
jgi:hypothetical protein